MALQQNFNITLDLKKQIAVASQIPTFIQNDTSTLFITLMDNGKAYDFASADRYVINLKRPDGKIITGLATYDTETQKIKYNFGSTEMELAGNLEVSISLFLGESRISTRPFMVRILKDYEEGIPSEEGYSVLQELFIEVDTVKSTAQEKAQYAQESGDYARAIRDNFGHKGNYDNTKSYKNGNVVSYGGVNYICVQDTTVGINPLNGSYWTVVAPSVTNNEQTWVATAGQKTFTLANGQYVVGKGNIQVFVGGVPQVSGVNFTESSETTISFSESVPTGVTIYAKWMEGALSITKGHKTGHEAGGQDELDVTKLKNFKENVTDQFTSVSAQLADIVTNVKSFGAKGDGVTDDTTAFSQAIDAAGIGGKIFVPKGSYVSNRLFLLDSQSIFGVGAESKIKFKSQHISSPSGFGGVINAKGNSSVNIKNVHVYDLYIDGNRSNITTPNPGTDDIDIECINLKFAENCTVSNVVVVNALDSGVDLDDSINCSVTGVRADNCGGYGVHLSTDSANITVSDSVAINCGGLHARGGFDTYLGVKNCKYVNCHAINCKSGFIIKGADNQLVNCSDIGATTNSLRIEGTRNKIVNFHAENSFNNSISIPSNYNELMNVSVSGANACFYIDGSNNKLNNCTAKSSVDGFRINGSSNILTSCTSIDPSRYGYEITAQHNSLTSCACENAQANALRITADSQRVVNFEARNTGVADTAIYVASNKNVFVGGSSRNNAKSGMWINAVANNILQGMSFIANGTYGVVLSGSNTKVIGCMFDVNITGAMNNTGASNKFSLNIGLVDN
jgi:hypothetical protein